MYLINLGSYEKTPAHHGHQHRSPHGRMLFTGRTPGGTLRDLRELEVFKQGLSIGMVSNERSWIKYYVVKTKWNYNETLDSYL